MNPHRVTLLASVGSALAGLVGAAPSCAADAPKLTSLTSNALLPHTGYKDGQMAPMGSDATFAGWLVLNGAKFRNSDYPELAKTLRQHYRKNGLAPPDPDFTALPTRVFEKDVNGEPIRGIAICPSRRLCGDLVGALLPFDLNSSL